MTGHYNPWIVALSYAVAVLASYLALQLTVRVRASRSLGSDWWTLPVAASILGVGIWSMHFVGMLAFSLPIPVPYDITITFLSLCCSVLASYIALRAVSGDVLDSRNLLASGACMGAGVALMHYTGMRALQVSPGPRYDTTLVVLSIGIAVAASIAALWLCFRLRAGAGTRSRISAAMVMGAAIAAMHYTAMAGTHFAPDSFCRGNPLTVQNDWLAGTLALFTLLMLAAVPAAFTVTNRNARRIDVSIRRWSRVSYSVNGVLLSVMAVLVTLLFLQRTEPQESATRRHASLLLADQLLLESEKLTGAALSVASTGDPQVKTRYLHLQDLRARFLDQMKLNPNLSPPERTLLEQIDGVLDGLTWLERSAISAMRDVDPSGSWNATAAVESATSLRILNGAEYTSSKQRLIETVERFRTTLEERTEQEEAQATLKYDSLLVGVVVVVFGLLVSLGSTFLFTREKVQSVLDLAEATRRIGQPGYRFAPADARDEIGELARVFESMQVRNLERTRELQHEINERVAMEHTLIQNEERFRGVVEAAPYGMAIVDEAGLVTLVNAEVDAMFGYPREELIGRSIEALLPPRFRGRHTHDRATFSASPTSRSMGAGRDLVAQRADGSEFPIEIGLSPIEVAGRKCVLCSMVDVTVRKLAEQSLRNNEAKLNSIIENLSEGVVVCELDGAVRHCNQAAATMHGFSDPAELIERWSTSPEFLQLSGMDGRVWSVDELPLYRVLRKEKVGGLEASVRRSDIADWLRVFSFNGTLVPGRNGNPILAVLTIDDVTERKREEAERQQAQKLESVGRLASGVAHEINSPVQFINDCCHFVRDGVRDLSRLLLEYRKAFDDLASNGAPVAAAREALSRQAEEADLGYLLENLPGAVDRSIEGLQRVTTIVRSMKEFAHPDQKEKTYADLNRAIQSTLTIARGEYKYVADLETDFGDLPLVPCYLGDFNQALLNMVINAAHAVESVVKGSGARGRIKVRTRQEGQDAVIEIVDTGCGIPESIKDKIFDPFFTTKPVGKGTGQGLSITRSVIVDRHGGSLSVQSREGSGTTFTIRLPLGSDAAALSKAA